MSQPVEPAEQDLQKVFLSGRPLLDVRAPVEFERGAFPGASNLPLLDNQQREAVGTRYKESGQAAAIKLGESLLQDEAREQRITGWTGFLQANPDALLYCFRGGLRSQICQQWLADSGIKVERVAGGYKRMRQFLLDEVESASTSLPWIVLGGRTGTGKTRLLTRLPRYVDLEGLARHRGSSFGKLPGGQPTPIDFENELGVELLRQCNALSKELSGQPVFIEDEGKLIGRVAVPEPLREQMARRPVALLEVAISHRVEITREDYVDDLLLRYEAQLGEQAGLQALAEHHRLSLSRIRKRLGGKASTQANKLLENALALQHESGSSSGFEPYLEFLLVNYYDPMYDYQLGRKNRPVVFRGDHDAFYDWALTAQAERHTTLQVV